MTNEERGNNDDGHDNNNNDCTINNAGTNAFNREMDVVNDADDNPLSQSTERGIIELVGSTTTTVLPPPSGEEADHEDDHHHDETISTPPRLSSAPDMSGRDGYPQFVPSLSASHLSEDGRPVPPSSPTNNSILAEGDSHQRQGSGNNSDDSSSSSSSGSSGSSDISLLIEEEVVAPRLTVRRGLFGNVRLRQDGQSNNRGTTAPDGSRRRVVTMAERCYMMRLLIWNATASLLMFVCWTVPILIVLMLAIGICILPTVCLLLCACCFFIGDRDAFAALWATLTTDDTDGGDGTADSRRPSPPPRKTRQELQDDMLLIRKVVKDGENDDEKAEVDIEVGDAVDAGNNGKSHEDGQPQKSNTIAISELPQNTCDICLLEYEPGDAVASPLHCHDCPHMFHQDCLLDWLQQDKTTCPCCRREYIKDTTSLSEAEALQSLTLLRSIYLRSQQQAVVGGGGASGDPYTGLPNPSQREEEDDDDDVLVIPPVVLGGDLHSDRLPRTRGINYFQMSLDSWVEEEEAQFVSEEEEAEVLEEDLEAGTSENGCVNVSQPLEDFAVSAEDDIVVASEADDNDIES